jgi:hypothetical protein
VNISSRIETKPPHVERLSQKCAIQHIASARRRGTLFTTMFKLIATMKRGSASGLAPAWARYATLAAARDGITALFRDERVLRVMVVRNEVPPAFVEWVER